MKRNKSLFTLILLTISIFTNSILYTQAETEYSYTGGVIETDWEDMEQHLYNGNISTYVTLPVYVDNSDLFPPPGNQENSKVVSHGHFHMH